MDFKEASALLRNGESIRRKSWPDMLHLILTKDKVVQGYRQEVVPFIYNATIMASDDWIVLGEEDIQIPFAVAVEKLRKRFKIKLADWPSYTYLELSENGKDLVMRKMCEYEYTPSFECFAATDWEIL